MPRTSTWFSLAEPGGASSLRTISSNSGIRAKSSSATLTTANTRRVVSKKCGANNSKSSFEIVARYRGRPSARFACARVKAPSSSSSDLSIRAAFCIRLIFVSTDSRSASASSISSTRKCSSGSLGPGISSSANARNT